MNEELWIAIVGSQALTVFLQQFVSALTGRGKREREYQRQVNELEADLIERDREINQLRKKLAEHE